ncbi:MAG: hypothetical protein ABSA83_15195 [Verrucomicrobiota bacterium]
MKIAFLILFSVLIAGVSVFAREDTNNRGPAADEIEKMKNQIVGVEAAVSRAIATEARSRGRPDMVRLTRAFSAATNELCKCRIEERAAAAEQAIRQAAATASRFDAGRNPNLRFDPAPFLQELKTLRGEISALLERISQLNATVVQVNEWTRIMRTILTQQELSARLQARMAEILSQWDNSPPTSATVLRPTVSERQPLPAPTFSPVPSDQPMVPPPVPPSTGNYVPPVYPGYIPPFYGQPVAFSTAYGAYPRVIQYVPSLNAVGRMVTPYPILVRPTGVFVARPR